MYKMIAIDVDDTLLDDNLQISEGTKQALALAISQGVKVTLATGRMFDSAKNVARQLNLNVPIITYQGSYIKNLIDEQIIYERHVPDQAVEAVFDYCEKHDLHLQIYYDDKLYVQQDNQKMKDYAAMSIIPYYVVDDLRAYIGKPLTKLLIIDEPDYLDQIAVELNGQIGQIAHITKSKAHYLEILNREGTKGHAVEFLANHWGCKLEEVIAIGDSWNDREMLEIAGLGVAMANAVESLKQVAKFVTLSNNDEGVKHVVDTFVFNRSES